MVPGSLVRRAAGDGSVIAGGAMYNMEIPLAGTRTSFYSFGGYNYKHSDAYANTRFWSNGQTKFPTDGQNQLLFNPAFMHVYDPTPGSLDTNHVFYSPEEVVYLKDASSALGFKGEFGQGWDWDLSANMGYNDFHIWGEQYAQRLAS